MVGELQPGDPQSVGPYRLLGRLGADGMGHVYLGRSPRGKTGGGQGYTAEIGRGFWIPYTICARGRRCPECQQAVYRFSLEAIHGHARIHLPPAEKTLSC